VAATVDGNAAPVDRNRRPVQEHQSDIAQRTGRPTPSGAVLPRSVFFENHFFLFPVHRGSFPINYCNIVCTSSGPSATGGNPIRLSRRYIGYSLRPKGREVTPTRSLVYLFKVLFVIYERAYGAYLHIAVVWYLLINYNK